MGTPEFPNLGRHCSVGDCRQNDFLPFTCDRCDQVLCLEHRSYSRHSCPKANQQDVTVIICPLCASSVRLLPNEDPNTTWQVHASTNCDPSNYQKATKKKKCPVHLCKETLVFSNTIKCRDCSQEHCLKHRFGPDHKCPGPKVQSGPGSAFFNRMISSKNSRASAGSTWSGYFSGGLAKLTGATSQALQKAKDVALANQSSSSGGSGLVEQCVQCPARFSSVKSLIEHVERVHQSGSHVAAARLKREIDICPKCKKEFADPVSLVMHVEKDHGGTSRAW